MAICDPDPEARAKAIRADLAPIADKLRQIGATIAFMEHPDPITHGVTMSVTTRGRLYDAVTAELERFAARSGGKVYRADPADIAAGDPDGECLAILSHIVVRRRAAA
ncbi:hypothetical protein [Bosea sp. ANAM02]|uniref:hypothetical protein n=1 Tax=Bosea sp. ANAM02 TaxID=2020412 RepID=UPI00140EA402|nr:hypothetical protein [Bosea sp. ANAM02]BCB17930.1 hypothetical protein OCUBac02_08240 [Bosea sp. ANAM02]